VVCDCHCGSKDYAGYGANALLTSAHKLLGSGYESWGEDLASRGASGNPLETAGAIRWTQLVG